MALEQIEIVDFSSAPLLRAVSHLCLSLTQPLAMRLRSAGVFAAVVLLALAAVPGSDAALDESQCTIRDGTTHVCFDGLSLPQQDLPVTYVPYTPPRPEKHPIDRDKLEEWRKHRLRQPPTRMPKSVRRTPKSVRRVFETHVAAMCRLHAGLLLTAAVVIDTGKCSILHGRLLLEQKLK
jgi:hypothetical protein